MISWVRPAALLKRGFRRVVPRRPPSGWLTGRVARKGAVTPTGTRVLVAGWFSWDDADATAGDLLARDVACRWLERAGRDYDLANAPIFGGGVDWRTVDPAVYSDILFVCGPIARRDTVLAHLLYRFGGSRHIGLDVSMIEDVAAWNPFDVLLERDSSRTARPDLAFASDTASVPILGVVLVEPYPPEYPGRDLQAESRAAVERLLSARPAARVPIDTRLDTNTTGLRNAVEVESLIARTDAVVTTRLHGLVLALKNGVPAVAIDPVAGGSKIVRQAEVLGWPVVRPADALDDDDLDGALEFCLSEEARTLALTCAGRAASTLEKMEAEIVAVLGRDPSTRLDSPSPP